MYIKFNLNFNQNYVLFHKVPLKEVNLLLKQTINKQQTTNNKQTNKQTQTNNKQQQNLSRGSLKINIDKRYFLLQSCNFI